MKKKIYIFGILIFLFDLISKIIIEHTLILNKQITIIKNFFYLNRVHNYGAAWSILENNRIFLIFIGIIVLYYLFKNINKIKLTKPLTISFSLLIGGILGNLYDRIVYGYVIDFISFKIINYYFPIFNFSDIAITFGTIILGIIIIRSDLSENRSNRKLKQNR